MSEERWLHAVPVRIDGENVILRGNLGGGYWVRKIDEEEVPFDDLDTRPNDRDAWRECAVRLANGLIYGLNEHAEAARSRYIAGDGPSLTCGCALCERYRLILAAFDELNSGRESGQPTQEEQNHGN